MRVSIRPDCCIALRMIALQAWYASEQDLWEIEMNDIVERLRDGEPGSMWDGAREILRLRADKAAWQGVQQGTAEVVKQLEAENEKLRAALERALIGGNHLATLIGVDHPLDTATHYEAAAHYAHTNNINGYEAWCCWKALRAAAAALKETAMSKISPMLIAEAFLPKDEEILRLRAENEKLRAALKPFADAANDLDDVDVGCIYDHPAANSIDCKDLRAAAAALKETGDE